MQEPSDCGTASCSSSAPSASACQQQAQQQQQQRSVFSRLKAKALSFLPRRSRGEQAPAAMELRMLLFWPWFVEAAFVAAYNTTTLDPVDNICVPLDVVIWACCAWSSRHMPSELIFSVPALMSALWVALYRRRNPDRYRRWRTAITSIRRAIILPFLHHQLRKLLPASVHPVAAGALQLLVLSGSLHTLIATAFFLNEWWLAPLEMVLTVLMFATAAPAACANTLAGPHPHAGWQVAAALMDRAALGTYSRSLQDPSTAHAVCCTTLNSVLVTVACLAAYLVHWFERQQRLRFKSRLPPAVAAMQGHLYGLPAGLVVAQALLVLLHPAMVISWLALGAWYGLMP